MLKTHRLTVSLGSGEIVDVDSHSKLCRRGRHGDTPVSQSGLVCCLGGQRRLSFYKERSHCGMALLPRRLNSVILCRSQTQF